MFVANAKIQTRDFRVIEIFGLIVPWAVYSYL
jgi:hypothetical protein